MEHPGKKTVVHVITGLVDGGAEGALYRLVRHDTSAAHHVISLTGEGKYGALLAEAGIPLTALDMKMNGSLVRTLRALYRKLRELKPDVVQTWLYHADLLGGIVARIAGIRNVFWSIRGTDFSKVGGSRSAHVIAKVCAPFSYVVPKRIIAVAERAIEVHRRMYYNTRKMTVVHNGYDFSQLKPSPDLRVSFREEMGVEKNVPLVGYVARFNEQKDHQTLLAALSELHQSGVQFRAVLVGTGITRDNTALVQAIAANNLTNRVALLGPRMDIPTVMNGLDLHVMSSAFGEGFPNVLAEAMACETPCVTTDVGDAAKIVDRHGWVVAPSSPAELARAIGNALTEWRTQPEAFRNRQRAGRKFVTQNFSITRMIEGFHAVWGS